MNRRILRSMEAPSSYQAIMTPVAWRWRWGRMGDVAWQFSAEKPGPFAEEGYEVEPLFTSIDVREAFIAGAEWQEGRNNG